jgi:3-oxoacyl-[acyl-carrier protein] reductase
MADVEPIALGRELEGRVALVTGAAANIGRAIALALACAGAAVVVHTRAALGEAEETARLARAAGGRATVTPGDLARPETARDLVLGAVDAFGRLDILVHNAAVRGARKLADLTPEDWRSIMAVDLDAAYLLARAAAPVLAGSDQGSIVTIGGMSGHAGAPGRAHVVAAKAGLAGLTRALAHDLAAQSTTVNCVVPGVIDTVRGSSAGAVPAQAGTLLGRPGQPNEVAALVRLLAGPGGRFVTGQTLHVNGGAYLG